MTSLNQLLNEMKGKPMTKNEQKLLEVLRLKVARKQLTVDGARALWAKRTELFGE